jgi:hypothetical protein
MTYDTFSYMRALRDDRTLTTVEYAVAISISLRAGTDGLNAHPGIELLSQEAKCSTAAVKRALKSLRDMNVIRLTHLGNKRQGLADTYKCVLPAQWQIFRDHSDTQKFRDHSDTPNTLLTTVNNTEEFRDHSDTQKVGGDLESSPALDPSSKAIECPHPSCKHIFPVGLSLDSPEFEAVFKKHYKAHTTKPLGVASGAVSKAPAFSKAPALKPAPARAPGLQGGSKWQCSECGGTFSYLHHGTMCKRCKRSIEGE